MPKFMVTRIQVANITAADQQEAEKIATEELSHQDYDTVDINVERY